jgi:tyrosinase
MGAAAAALTGCASTLRQCQQQIQNRPTRRNVANMAPDDPVLVAFRSAIQQMKALPSSDPRSWSSQAAIHLNHCPHENWLLLPWHRAYLYYFERICRSLSGMTDFAIPYWDWSTAPSVPSVYWNTADPLYDTRAVTASTVLDPGSVGPAELESILEEPSFDVFASGSISATADQRTRASYGPLEATPHNYVHVTVGGLCCDMGNFNSPLDPIFWAHHGMLDRCWVDWNLVRNNPNTDDPAWVNRTFSEFSDENGNSVQVGVVDTLLMPIFSYQYDAPIGGTAASPAARVARDDRAWQSAKEAQVRRGATIRTDTLRAVSVRPPPVEIGRPLTQSFAEALAPAAGTRTLLRLEGTSTSPDVSVRVFVDRPDATADTPATDPGVLATFSFFIHAHAGVPATASFVYDVTAAMARRSSTSAPALTFVLIPLPGRPAQATTFSPGVVSLELVKETIATP